MKKVIVISTSLRAGSNSDMLADKFIEGALKSGNPILPRMSGMSEIRQMRNQRRRKCHNAKSPECRCHSLGYTYLLL